MIKERVISTNELCEMISNVNLFYEDLYININGVGMEFDEMRYFAPLDKLEIFKNQKEIASISRCSIESIIINGIGKEDGSEYQTIYKVFCF